MLALRARTACGHCHTLHSVSLQQKTGDYLLTYCMSDYVVVAGVLPRGLGFSVLARTVCALWSFS